MKGREEAGRRRLSLSPLLSGPICSLYCALNGARALTPSFLPWPYLPQLYHCRRRRPPFAALTDRLSDRIERSVGRRPPSPLLPSLLPQSYFDGGAKVRSPRWEEEEEDNKGNEVSGKEAIPSASSAELVTDDRLKDLSPKLDRPLFFRVSYTLSTYLYTKS